ncbi:MAG TPA: MgtC/SapB family protein [Vicinamibacterales bacterium]
MADFFPALGVVVAALGGAAIGVERQWSGHATGTHPHLGGVRTFTLIGGAAGLAGVLATAGYGAVAATVVVGLVALIVIGYLAASRNHIDATTEVAAVVVVATGFLAGIGWIQLSSGAVAITALLLIEKSRLHAFVERIDDEELRAAVRFAVMAVVVLPILPEGPLERFGGIRPRELWLFVLFFSGISFVGYVARRAIGSAQGYPWAGLLGGLVSSTAVTFSFARLSRSEPTLSRALAIGALGASTVVFPRVLVATVVLNADVARTVALLTTAAFVIGAAVFVWYLRHVRSEAANVEGPRNPLQLGPALQMAVTFQIVLFAVQFVRRWFGDAGLLISGAVLGLTDVDALTLSMARGASAGIDPGLAARAITVGIMSNCVMKAILSITLGTRAYGWFTTATLAVMVVAMGVALVIVR